MPRSQQVSCSFVGYRSEGVHDHACALPSLLGHTLKVVLSDMVSVQIRKVVGRDHPEKFRQELELFQTFYN
jgi:hypothetical protein